MLDLDSLAEKCAKTANEQIENWRKVIWSEDFQAVAKNMSDGEVNTLVRACGSLVNLEGVVKFLKSHTGGPDSPFAAVTAQAKAAGKDLQAWISSLKGKS